MNSTRSQLLFYRIATGLLTLMLIMTVMNSVFNTEFSSRFVRLGYPEYLIIPLMIAKVVGIITIWSNVSSIVKEWAYISFFFLFILALLAEINASDTDYVSPVLALILLLSSYRIWKNITNKNSKE
ncbi:DoxX family protein [Aquimarina sediminis]|uniref:DoxX family protein n=1 Tax=Aquimarina sediminis TaxID=2070536 RepID=UPI000CA04643|nr:DoxX family protein [Aquimarina sediminis]